MAKDRITERGDVFNQLSSSSTSHKAFQAADRSAKLEFTAMLLAKADALSAVALRDAFIDSDPAEQHHYLAALNELIVASREQLDDVLTGSHSVESEQ